MQLRSSLIFLFFITFNHSIFCQEINHNFDSGEKDSLALERRKRYEERLKFIEEIRRRREKDPQRYADSIANLREQRRFEEATKRIGGYKASNISKLVELDLTGARLKELPEWILEAKNLEVLVLDHNHISELPKRLGELDSLKRIYWRYNDLNDKEIKIPRLASVEKLDLTGNSLSKLPKVYRLKELTELVLEENAFHKIPTWRGRRLKQLKELDISKNPVKIDRRWYGLLDHIEVLKLNKCQIDDLHPSLYKIKGLKELQIQVNNLQTIPSGISLLENLEKLSFYKNQLSLLPDDFFDLRLLRVIDLYYNQFEKLPTEVSNLRKLEILYFSFNKLYDIPEEIGDLKQLEELYIHHNRLSEIPASLKNLKQLKILHFQNNYITEFPTQILKMNSLRDLDISHTDISTIPKEITDLKLKNFYWRDLDINLNDPRKRYIGEVLVQLRNQGTNVVPNISMQELSDN